jgi:hypothetical protein
LAPGMGQARASPSLRIDGMSTVVDAESRDAGGGQLRRPPGELYVEAASPSLRRASAPGVSASRFPPRRSRSARVRPLGDLLASADRDLAEEARQRRAAALGVQGRRGRPIRSREPAPPPSRGAVNERRTK